MKKASKRLKVAHGAQDSKVNAADASANLLTRDEETKHKTPKKSGKEKQHVALTQKKLSAYFSSYHQGHSTAEQLIEHIDHFRKDFSAVEFVLLCLPSHNITLKCFFQKDSPQDDRYFQWLLDEIEKCSEQLPTVEEVAKAKALSALMQKICWDESHLQEVLKRDAIKAIIHGHYAVDIINYFFRENLVKSNPLAFFQNYFPEERLTQLKNTLLDDPFDENSRKNFLDHLFPQFIEYIPELWDKGFRPYSIDKFRRNLFSLPSHHSRAKLPKDFFSKASEAYQKLLTQQNELGNFPEPMDLMVYSLDNPAINVDLLKMFLEKNKLVPDLSKFMSCLASSGRALNLSISTNQKDEERAPLSEKIIYFLSQLHEPFESSASAQFIGSFVKQFTGNYFSLNNDLTLNKVLQSISSIANELFFYVVIPYIVSAVKCPKDHYTQLKNLFEFFKSKEVSQSSLLSTFLLAYLIHSPSAGSKLAGKAKKSSDYPKQVLQEMLDQLIKEIPAEELNLLVNDFVTLAKTILFYHQEAMPTQELAGLPLFAHRLTDFTLFVSGLITIVPGQRKQLTGLISKFLSYKLAGISSDNSQTILQNMHQFFAFFDIEKENKSSFTAMTLASYVIVRALGEGEPCPLALLNTISEFEPSWIKQIPEVPVVNTDVLTYCLKNVLSLDPSKVEKNLKLLCHFLELLINNEVNLPLSFLKAIAEVELNIQTGAQLSDSVKARLKEIYNQCLHKVQGTEQEIIFEEHRTELLIKFGIDPANDPQAIHVRENHVYADKIYAAWWQALAETVEEKIEKLAVAKEQFFRYILQEKNQMVKTLVSFKDVEKLTNYVYFLHGNSSVPDVEEFKKISQKLAPHTKLHNYMVEKAKTANIPITPQIPQLQARLILDAQKLFRMIAMATYYTNNPGPAGFAIQDGSEALKILLLELLDQVEHPSCDQGPFMRLLMALETVSEFKFPHLTRRSMHFYIKEYINNYFHNLSSADKKGFIDLIYEKTEDKEALEIIDFIQEGSLTFLAERFFTENAPRRGFINLKEVTDFFYLQRPAAYHPEIIAALNQCHQETKALMAVNRAQNSSGFFRSQAPEGHNAEANINLGL